MDILNRMRYARCIHIINAVYTCHVLLKKNIYFQIKPLFSLRHAAEHLLVIHKNGVAVKYMNMVEGNGIVIRMREKMGWQNHNVEQILNKVMIIRGVFKKFSRSV